jgi:hypothetical protein
MNDPTAGTPSSQVPEQPAPEITAEDAELAGLQAELLSLQAQGQNGANWFYWVAGLSLVNAFISLVGGGVSFVFGLGITEFVGGFAAAIAGEKPELATAMKIVGFGFAVVAAAVLVGFGWLSNKRFTPIFALGIVLYALDALLYLWFQMWISVAFHGFALFQMWQGLLAYRKLSAILRTQPVPG